jgi:hypothetical protein
MIMADYTGWQSDPQFLPASFRRILGFGDSLALNTTKDLTHGINWWSNIRSLRKEAVTRLKLTSLIVLAMSAAFSIGQTQQQRSRKFTAEDYMEIQQLYWNYALAMDIGDSERYAALFVGDGEFTPGRGPGRANDNRQPHQG